jgi:hypothetical protein
MIVAAAYAFAGSVSFFVLRMMQRRHPSLVVQPLSTPALGIAASTASRDIPGGIISVGLLAAAGYFMGRSMGRKP